MKLWSPLTIGLVVCLAAALIGVGIIIYRKLRRKADPAELERLRRIELGRTGRIISGEITCLLEPEGEKPGPLLLVYRYDVGGVTYEVSQDVFTMPQVAAAAARMVGGDVVVKYEIKHPSNSIVICEVWSGIRGISLSEPESASPPPVTAEVAEKS